MDHSSLSEKEISEEEQSSLVLKTKKVASETLIDREVSERRKRSGLVERWIGRELAVRAQVDPSEVSTAWELLGFEIFLLQVVVGLLECRKTSQVEVVQIVERRWAGGKGKSQASLVSTMRLPRTLLLPLSRTHSSQPLLASSSTWWWKRTPRITTTPIRTPHDGPSSILHLVKDVFLLDLSVL